MHLLTGWDHLAFVLGLVLLVSGGRRLFVAVTAFTLGHNCIGTMAAFWTFERLALWEKLFRM